MKYPKQRPKVRGECKHHPRPCPFISCRWHMIWNWAKTEIRVLFGLTGFKLMRRLMENLHTIPYSCVLDITDKGGATLEEIGQCCFMTRERVRQIELTKKGGAIRKLRHPSRIRYVQDFRGVTGREPWDDSWIYNDVDLRGLQ